MGPRPYQTKSPIAVIGALVLLYGIFVGVLPSQAAGPEPTDLVARIERILERSPLAGAKVGIHVERVRDGRVVFSKNADRLLIPASNQKLMTTLVALERFGPAHRFSTRIFASGTPDAEGRVSELLIEGGGDPAMNSEDWWRLAAELRQTGLRGVIDGLRVDDQLFAGPRWHASWGKITARAYHAPIGALTANYGSFFVAVEPQTKAGLSAVATLAPPVRYLRLLNLAKTVSVKKRPRLAVERLRNDSLSTSAKEIIRVSGNVAVGASVDRIPRSVRDPGLYAASVLAYQLEANGIEVADEVRRAPLETGERLTLLREWRGRTLSEIVSLCLKYSNNSIAESLLKSLGAWDGVSLASRPTGQGDWVQGIRVLREELTRLGIALGQARLVDGSGLSTQNRLTPRLLVEVLRIGKASFRMGPEFVAALPIAGTDGTLGERFDKGHGRIRAKTGLLSKASVTSLSGFAERVDGDVLIFSILVNGHRGGSGAAMQAVDRIARTLLDAPLPHGD
ncbi:MAG: D-alanyl-D-alanine carboxypeptidase/D-alanyl-D-alanine-endopeptidase, partial [Myxococcota bacterium]